MAMFVLSSPIPVGNKPVSNATADLDGDGDLDLLYTNYSTNNVSVLLNNGSGVFVAGTPVAATNGPREIEIGDLDGDGDFDFLATNLLGANVTTGLNNGNATFVTSSVAVGTAPRGLAVGDLDGDGDLDFIAVNYGADSLSVMLNNGNGTFAPAAGSPVPTGGTDPVAVVLVNLDGDLDLDIAVTNNDNASAAIFFNNGSGGFVAGAPAASGTNPRGIAAGDFDGDGDADLVVANFLANSLSILQNNGSGVFSPLGGPIVTANNPYAVAVADFDGDGDLDIAVNNSGSASINVFVNDGAGGFSAASGSPIAISTGGGGLLAGDFDGDGDLDIATSGFNANVANILLNQANQAPSGADATLVGAEDTPRIFSEADFGFSDPNGTPFTLLAVKITTLPSSGAITHNGVAVLAGAVIPVADIASGLLAYAPPANANGAGAASFTFQVQDNGGTADSGVDTDGSPNTITFDITAGNDAPAFVGLNSTPANLQGAGALILDSSVEILDIDLTAPANFAGASLTLARQGGANPQDVFSGGGALSALTQGGALIVSGTTIGTVTQNSGGTLVLNFNANATQALVNAGLSAIRYANTLALAPATITIDWAFTDGNTGSQGSGGALTGIGSTVVTIVAPPTNVINDDDIGHTLIGVNGPDFINGNGGNDTIFALAGQDIVHGGDGNDLLVGNANAFLLEPDTLLGEGGDDAIYAETSDTINGGSGTDALHAVNTVAFALDMGATSFEIAWLDFGNDFVTAASQTAGVTVIAGGGNDTVTGSNFADVLRGGTGNDSLLGGNGDDGLLGDAGIDALDGGEGNDLIYFDNQDAFVSGGNGSDIGYIATGPGVTVNAGASSLEFIQDLAGGNDTILGATAASGLIVAAGGGNDSVEGGSFGDLFYGETGNDTLIGNGGNDTLVGGTGTDTLSGGAGLDALFGNGGLGGDGVQDVFRFQHSGGANADAVFDFEVGIDKIDLSVFGSSFANVSIIDGGGFSNVYLNGLLICSVFGAGTLTAPDFIL